MPDLPFFSQKSRAGLDLEAESRRISVRGWPKQKVSELPSQPTSWAWWYLSVISTMLGRLQSEAGLGKSETLSEK
jgi:hypothetical protein